MALSKITKNGLGVLVIRNNLKKTIGILTDGDIKRLSNGKSNFHSLKIKKVMTKNPVSVEKNMLAAHALSIMNTKKITSLCVPTEKTLNKKNKKIKAIVHVHRILDFGIK